MTRVPNLTQNHTPKGATMNRIAIITIAALLTTTAVDAAPRAPRPTPPPVSTEPGVAVPPMVTPPVVVVPPVPVTPPEAVVPPVVTPPVVVPTAPASVTPDPAYNEPRKEDWSMQATWCPMIPTVFGGMAYQTNVNLDCTVQPL